ncbi:hydantoinase/oxoprolinase family protein [Roseococcus sp. SDR]|uniref:hydantoinase/oxoprolinase family protein n=1 Tax=Roseococcus sp. SDR TaxID=2835532 RepID=UPI001BCF93D1|nr:hydantoinase/oxoprolinase family protein [Roseococcus sp. SDR]MBS7790345.1 hydantoinase/oxoprolinase family protein [Roseococcus sp. SDR]MBV1845659.1 hydantoinase/oxoprolinase family protein [Roseococcus sp. SDR]
MRYTIGVDVGGTFTDVVGVDEEGREFLAKAPSTPGDQSEGVLDGLANLAAAIGLTLAELLEATTRIVHGTTVATNALLERRGAKTAMLTTEGHRDVIAMREGLKPARYDLRLPQPPPLVPRALRLPVRERLRPDGRVEIPLDAASLASAIGKLRDAEVESVAICFLHSWAAPQHEHAAAEAVRAALPGVFVTCSADVLPQIKEFERFSTTAVNAYVGPVVSRYLTRLEARLRAAGYTQPVFVILSHGGMAPIGEAARLAVGTALSGPAGGVAAAVALARRGMGDQLVTLDMGGTSTDIALIQDGAATLGRGREVGGERIALDSLDIITLGAGGGSIAHLGARGTLEVGPQSAGARPGPACYGHGGTEPTVTDANLALGYLDATRFLGGARLLDAAASERAIAALAAKLNLPTEATALGIHRLVNARMADGVRVATVRRGVDPRGATLLAFGGAAGLHASAVARDLGMARIAVPLFAAGLSAWGMLQTELRHEIARSVVSATAMPEDAALAALFAGLESDARLQLAQWFRGEVQGHRAADLRYGEQVFEITVNLDGVPMTRAGLREAFHARHRALFTYDLPEEEVVLVTARAAAAGLLPPAPRRPAGATTSAAPLGVRRALLEGGWAELPVWDFAALAAGQSVAGPAIVESATTTILLLPGDVAEMDAGGWLSIRL